MTYFLILFLIGVSIAIPVLLNKMFPINPYIPFLEEEIERLKQECGDPVIIKTLHLGPVKLKNKC